MSRNHATQRGANGSLPGRAIPKPSTSLSCIEICAGAGGQAIGLERSGFEPEALIEIEKPCRETLVANRPDWNVVSGQQCDVRLFDGRAYKGIDLLAGGVPCPPFSVAGKQLGKDDERDLFPHALRLVDECRPQAVMLENVRGFLAGAFEGYRRNLKRQLRLMGYTADWKLLNASDFGVSQLRPRVVIIALKKELGECFSWPLPNARSPATVGEALGDLMSARNWRGAGQWMEHANGIAPTIVGGSKKHGGPDLGPTRARQAWAALGVNGLGVADEAPDRGFVGMPKLTVRMVARLQGFPDEWHFAGRKTPTYRQVGNAFPPPVAHVVAEALASCLRRRKSFPLAG